MTDKELIRLMLETLKEVHAATLESRTRERVGVCITLAEGR